MVVFTAKLTKRKVVTCFLALGVIVCATIVGVRNMQADDSTKPYEQVIRIEEKKLKTNDDRVAMLEGYGWTVDREPLEFIEVRIPDEFDGVYNEYNDIQKKQGLDLQKYCGKRAMRYTYKVTNHPSKEDGVVANIIVYRNKLIGGDICSPKLGGFMHGLSENTVKESAAESDSAEKETQE